MTLQKCINRLQQELESFLTDPMSNVDARPSAESMLTWWFVIDGPEDTPYAGGEYVGKITFPEKYPFNPPSIMMVTPSGRFAPEVKISLSITDDNKWCPAWNTGSILQGFICFFATDERTVGAVRDSTEAERVTLAKKSRSFNVTLPAYQNLFPARYAIASGNAPPLQAPAVASTPTAAPVAAAATAPVAAAGARRERDANGAAAGGAAPPTSAAPPLARRAKAKAANGL
jgi:ubiquitin-conjugating enzyme E2 J2